MRDEEFIQLRNKFLFGLTIFIIFAIPIFFLLRNKMFIPDSKIIKSLKNKDSMVILIVDNKCNRCDKSKEVLTKLDVNYFILNKSTNRDYNRILRKLELTEEDLEIPTIILVNEGKLYSYITNIKSKQEITDFVKNYNLNGGN
jgi:uncharacterized membrane protein